MITLRATAAGYDITGIPQLGERISVVELSPTDRRPLPATTAIVHGWKPDPRGGYQLTYWPWGVQGMSQERVRLLDGAEVGRLSEGERLRLELERRSRQDERSRTCGLRETIKQSKAERRTGKAFAAAFCRSEREATTAAARAARAQIAERRALDRQRCDTARHTAQALPTARIDLARAELAEALERRRTERRWKGEGPSKAARKESREDADDRVRAELPAELQPVWDRHKRRFAEGAHRSRLEAFQEWAAEHRADVESEIQRDLERSIDRMLESERGYYEDREAAEGMGGIQMSDHHVTIEPDPQSPGKFWVRNQRGHVFLHAASLESARETARSLATAYRYEIHDHSERGQGAVLIEWGAQLNARKGHGWLPQVWENGKEQLHSYGSSGLEDEAAALEAAEYIARERLERYSGDWVITLRRRAAEKG